MLFIFVKDPDRFLNVTWAKLTWCEWLSGSCLWLAEDLVFDQATPICLGPSAWEWQPWAKESWWDPRWAFQSYCKPRALLPLEVQNHSSKILNSSQSTSLWCTWGTSLGPAADPTAVSLILSHSNRLSPIQKQGERRGEERKEKKKEKWRWVDGIQAAAWQIQPQGTDTKPEVFAHPLMMVLNTPPYSSKRIYTKTNCNLTTHPLPKKMAQI